MTQSNAQMVAKALRHYGTIPDDPRLPAEITQNSRIVLGRRYLVKDEHGAVAEQPNDMFWRVADNLAQAEYNYTDDPEVFEAVRQRIYNLLVSLLFLPNSPTLMNAGRELQQLSACFVLPVPDSIEDIFTAVRSTAIIHKSGGGTGFDFSRLRPEGDRVRSTNGVASGPVSFIDAFDAATDVVKQGGTRRGANMGILRVDHPDVMEFILRKATTDRLQNFNVSVAATDAFMRAVQDDRSYELIHPNSKAVTGTLPARQVFDAITQAAWQTGDPGMVFIDAINRDNPNPHHNAIESTNPCVTADTIVATADGPRTVADLVGVPFNALVNGQRWPSTPMGFFRTGLRPVVTIATDSQHRITLTPDHRVRIRTPQGDAWTQAERVQPGDAIVLNDYKARQDDGATHQAYARMADLTATAVREPSITDTTANPTAVVTSITPRGVTSVYDCQIPGINAFDGNGFYLHQCGEQPLGPNESCNLGSLNVARMVKYDDNRQAYVFDHDLLNEVIDVAVRLLDNVIDMNDWPLEEIKEASLASRRIGVGIMGFADLLIILGIPYGSPEALDTARSLMAAVKERTWAASQKLAEERGPYPAYDGSAYEQNLVPPMRNTAPVTIAPTGTISIIAGTSSGIEPLFALAYSRNVMDNTHMTEFNYLFDAVSRYHGFNSPAALAHVEQEGSPDHPDIPQWAQELFQVSHQIEPIHHVDMQGAFQESTDNAVSKTINLPNEADEQDVADAYNHAWAIGCKGITVYRDGSKQQQVLSTQATHNAEAMVPVEKEPRDRIMPGETIRINTGHGTTYVTINAWPHMPRVPFEVFANMGKAGSCDSANIEAICRITSTALRAGVSDEEIISQLQGITCHPHWDQGMLVKSTPDAIAQAMRIFRGDEMPRVETDGPKVLEATQQPLMLYAPINPCPECGSATVMAEGCRHCPACGWNQCE